MKRLLFFICMFLSITIYSQEKRLALVIGNGEYEYGAELKNPINDAIAMNKALSQVGFEVLVHTNLDEGELKRAIDEFGQKLMNYDVGLFYYAGHGIQAKGENFLIPIDANLLSEQQVEYDCVEAARVLSYMEVSRSNVNIIILDACRNNPFERSWTRSAAGNGLAFMNAPSGTLIAYATAPGKTASDGTGTNGLYTEAILESILIPNITVLEMFQNVREYVEKSSNNYQTPWEATSLTGSFYFQQDKRFQESNRISNLENSSVLLSTDKFGGLMQGDFLDTRDNQTYQWIRIADDIWMAENLNFETEEGSWCFGNLQRNCDLLGRLYNWKTAMNACPDGWHLSSEMPDWMILELNQVGMEYPLKPKRKQSTDSVKVRFGYKGLAGKLKITGTNLWINPNKGATNDIGFNAKPSGDYQPYKLGDTRFKFSGRNSMTAFWTPNENEDMPLSAYVVTMYYNSEDAWVSSVPKNWGNAVRCVKNKIDD